MPVLIFIKDLLLATFSQMTSLLAGVFIFGLIIHFFSQLTFKSLETAFGRFGTYLVAWLGTPIHELGHALFCVIFGHRISKIEFFNPDPVSGTLGFVEHRWDRHNPWAVLGNFFIGIGPVILGCGVLFAAFYLLVPNSYQAWDFILVRVNGVAAGNSVPAYLGVIGDSAFSLVKVVFVPSNLTAWRFWIFVYLSYCIASNIRLSFSDIKGSLSGLGCVVLPFLLLNLVGLLTGIGSARLFPVTASSLGIIYALLILALILVITGSVITYLVSAAYVKIRHGYLLKPF